jgi:ABC-type nitrate/sulfonate/bicarbonate transport system substrate-binding protein
MAGIDPPMPAPLSAASLPTRPRPLRLGFLALTDAAPLAAADALGLFARHGLQVELRREIGWATIREKIIYGELDAAQAPAPMLWATQLGLGCRPTEVLTAFVLNLHGNALTLSRALRDAGVRDSATLRQHARSRPARSPLTFGAVFPYSSNHLMLREWLREAGLEPDRDVRIVVVPPAQMFRNLVAGTIDGFCSGEPWNSVAVREGIGWCPVWSAACRPGHVEKVLLVTRQFAESRPAEHAALVRALAEAAVWCDEPHHRERLAELLAGPRFLNLPVRDVAPTLLGRFDCGDGRIESVPDFHVFHRGNANRPDPAKAAALQRDLAAAGLLDPLRAADSDLPRRLFRSDLHREFLSTATHVDIAAPALR